MGNRALLSFMTEWSRRGKKEKRKKDWDRILVRFIGYSIKEGIGSATGFKETRGTVRPLWKNKVV